MSFGQKLKDRLFSLQEDITTGVRSLSVPSSTSVTSGLASLAAGAVPKSPQYKPSKVNPEAGSDLLEYYQNVWEEIHTNNDKNAKMAAKCDRQIVMMHENFEARRNNILTLQMLVSQIPKVNEQIDDIMKYLGNLESSFSDVEIALLALEDTIDARELQEKQLEQRFQVAMYQEKRQAQFNQLRDALKTEYEKSKKNHELALSLSQKQRQQQLQKDFEEDMKSYANNGLLKVPARCDPDASLETVDLNEDESALEQFLEDVSPLPVDPSVNTSYNASPEESPVGKTPGIPHQKDVSLYFTPDSTLEKISSEAIEKAPSLED